MTHHASPIIGALEAAWSALQAEFPSLPDAVITIGAGTGGKHAFHGLHASERWRVGSGELVAEIVMAGESFERGAVPTFGTLAHEAVHAYCRAKGIQDTSRQGRYHNKKFAKAAGSFGLDISEAQGIGWSVTTVPAATSRKYADVIAGIEQALTLQRQSEHRPERKAAQATGYVKCICGCPDPHIVRMSVALADQLVVRCDDCLSPFEPA